MKKLSEYAKEHNITYRTAHNHFKKGLIDGVYQLPTGTIVIPDKFSKENFSNCIVTYARVSSSENKDNLESQSQRLIDYCNANGWKTNENIKEIGSGLNDKRNKLLKLLKKQPSKIVIEHKDRLTRFGFNYLKLYCDLIGCEIVIINEQETSQKDLMEDFVSIITSFCARLYGLRRSKRKTEEIIKKVSND